MERLPLLKSFEEKHAYYSVLIQMRWNLTLLISCNINNHVIPSAVLHWEKKLKLFLDDS